ncbi:vacuolar protein sorting-associated protein 9A-like isoform X1 [Lolium perenne]|uniref:vacuolar protein sorting-associated protein 9A-like isoform X1 n=1 Tax=Lolium perenne TaxID=4522 RepID=UPI0021F67713|nr:vacuolar protein sorting-associated protein 9A-like isoform X1 [Lolium perenne]XP_051207765.1 vacuolar protein sorting-associated protein 9A-like isoform X1 [Lolium perenne]
MESPSSASAASQVDFYGFLDRMRRPAAAGLFRSIKSFLTLDDPSAEADGARVQAFYAAMEAAFREHPLWANATHQEIDHALEGLEKYIMTKLFDRTFGASPEDAAADAEVSERIGLLQRFVRPEHLDIPKVLHNEASWLLAVKELQKINSFKSPRDKLLCVMSCCQVINNLLLNVSMSNDRTPSGADEFLPILIYITIKANPPHLHSNLKFVQLFRRETKLVSEVEYYLTNLISAKMFIVNVDGRSLSMEENEFQMHMETAKLGTQICAASLSSPQGSATSTRGLQKQTDTEGSRFPFMDSETESLTAAELKQMHRLYRQVVTRYTSLSKALRKLSIDEDQLRASVDDDS